jgi:hypothetical protein
MEQQNKDTIYELLVAMSQDLADDEQLLLNMEQRVRQSQRTYAKVCNLNDKISMSISALCNTVEKLNNKN